MKASSPAWYQSWQGWRQVFLGTWRATMADHSSLIAAGCAFYATAAFFPAAYTVVVLYGTLLDTSSFERALRTVSELIPRDVYGTLLDWVQSVLYVGSQQVQTHLTFSTAALVVSAMGGTRAMMQALNLALHEKEQRPFLEVLAVALALTMGGLILAVGAFALIVALPLVLSVLGVPRTTLIAARICGAVVGLLCVLFALGVMYRFAPSRKPPGWKLVSEGSMFAVIIWALASEGFALYGATMSRLGSSASSAGPISSALVIMVWFYVLSYAVLVGGELNAQIQCHKPDGERPRSEVCEGRD